jgi:Flp pilus assembly protein TadG
MRWPPTHPTRRDLLRARDGTAAVEFALIFPLMLTLFFGSFELTSYVTANLKLSAATETAGDLVGQTRQQTPTITTSDIDNYTSAAGLVMTPLPLGPGLSLAYASIIYNAQGAPQVDWHWEEHGAPIITTGSLDAATLKKLGSGTDTIILVKAQYTYNSPFSWVLGKQYTIMETVYNRPRYVTKVLCSNC